MIKARFIGRDKSMGFRKGKIYRIETEVKGGMIFVKSNQLSCPYSRVETMLQNWQILEDDSWWSDF